MKSFQTVTSAIIPLPLADIDTDMIIPAQHLTSTKSSGYGEFLFERLRKQDPDFPLNQEKFKNAKILMTERNFGCGSSREHAVWALHGWGIEVVIAPSFADIFFSNSAKNGLVLVRLPEEKIAEMLEAGKTGNYVVTVDLASQTVTLPNGEKVEFPFDPFRKECILKGYDDLDYLLAHQEEIQTYQKKREEFMFYSTLVANKS